MESQSRILKRTNDSSDTLYSVRFNQTYHSVHGARSESEHVFIKNGLLSIRENINPEVLEVGLGTGLNYLLSHRKCLELKKSLSYTAIEAFPISLYDLNDFNFGFNLSEEDYQHLNLIHNCEPRVWHVTASGRFKKIVSDLYQTDFPNDHFDLIYFDAFSPGSQPEMWTLEVFTKMFNTLKKQGVLVTYCAKGDIKRTMRAVGFEVKALPGPPGKREMTFALKP